MELAILMAGIVYGLIIGLIPAAGATTGLITLFGVMPYFVGDPYLGVIFCVAVVASSTTRCAVGHTGSQLCGGNDGGRIPHGQERRGH